ncbi:neurotrophin-4 isoform X1 [Callorhinchus milii]|uniref:Neurotrophin-4 n=1 Tax=Callorhinchus milii TaxID=7868 RepID=F1BZW3_CALMI|nr:neurotrophin-4 precursor [Callorhinchus milii]XP_007908052.1 neurotrophin-4 isoform X1 [Callorhinchus milii]XP_007908053.1 neurotrophin-4 isoform X1 [Callorhinchus milii]ADX01337.1 neurotrophin-4a [Callorhinchus milii]AGD98734.1 neurotrophin-4 precursor [Callorhinchus milii]|eukprot:gi/632982283/ref/XP_007908052.1/ PREDICTED: neurotrophin-4-like [Callorhinchus milii]
MIILLYAMAVSYFGGVETAPVNLSVAMPGPQAEQRAAGTNDSLGSDFQHVSPESWEKEWDLYSPRVMLASEPPGIPPLLFIMEASLSQAEVANRTERARRQAGGEQVKPTRRGELSVCDSINFWVTDKRTAVDINGWVVSVLNEVPTSKGPMKQFFYETKCNNNTSTARSGCRGVDKRHWVSECKTKQSFVRALTVDHRKQAGWRWIRIDTACVCALNNRTTRT